MMSNNEFTQSMTSTSSPTPMKDINTEEKTKEFIKIYERDLAAFGLLTLMKEIKDFMLKRPYLACEETAKYLVIRCFILEMEKKHDAMKKAAHQFKCIQSILELAKENNDDDPKSYIAAFFDKIQIADSEYKYAFECELIVFIGCVRAEAERKELKKRLEDNLKKQKTDERV